MAVTRRGGSSTPSGAMLSILVLIVLAVPMAFPILAGVSGAPAPQTAASPPQTLVLQPDAANGTDTFLLDATPDWNYGTNTSLQVGPDLANGSVARSLLAFDLRAVPSSATVLNATLGLYEAAGGAGPVQVRRMTAPWTEGDGQRSWTSVPITVRETAGVRRTQEPVGVPLTFLPNALVDPARDLRVYSGGVEVPSQVYSYVYSGGRVVGAQLYFGVSIAPLATEVFDVVYSTNGTAVPAYRTKAWGSAAQWTSPAVGSGASGVSVVDLNGDGGLDVVYGTESGYVYALNGDGTTQWATRLSTTNSVPFAPQVADLDGDGQLDVVVVTNDPSLVRLNRTLGVVWTTPMPVPDLPLGVPVLADVNQDAVLDVLVGRRSKAVDVFDGVTGLLFASYTAGDWAYSASLADITGDGLPEVFFSSDDFLVHAYNLSGSQRWAASPVSRFIENPVAIGDVNGDGVLDVVTGDDMAGGGEFALNTTNGATVWFRPLPSYREGGQTLADLNGDGMPEVIVGLFDGTLHALRGQDGVPLWTYPGGTTQGYAPAVVDLTKDGRAEVVYMDKGTVLRVLNDTGALVHSWNITADDPGLRSTAQRALTTPAIADLDGDGTLEVIVPTGSGVQAFATGGLARDWRTFGYNWNHTHRADDGNSPDGAPFLQATVGFGTVHPASGASWDYRDGVAAWISPGADFGIAEANSSTASGWNAWNVTAMVRDWFSGTFPNVGLAITEGDEAAGARHAFASSDEANATLRPRLTITYTVPVPDPVPRILRPIPDFFRVEDSPPWSLDLMGFAADDDTPANELRWNVSGLDPRIVAVSGTNVPGGNFLTFYPQKDANGDMAVTYWLTDPQGQASGQRAWINITPVNDPPVFTPPTTLVVRYNRTYVFDFGPYLSDVDTPRPVLRLTSNDAHAVVAGFNVSFLYPQSYLDQWAFVGFVASDGQASVGRVVAVKVTADDPPAVKLELPNVTLREGELLTGVFDLDDHFTDPNNDALFFSYGYTHLTITIRANHSVDILAASTWNGQEQVTFRSRDPTGAIAEDTITVTVLPVDNPPVLGPVPNLRVHYDVNYTFNLDPYISDPDTPLDEINASTSSSYVAVSGHLLILLYPQALNGTVQNLTIWIRDRTTVVSRTIRVTVGDDFPPVRAAKMPDVSFLEDARFADAYDLRTFFSDPDGSQLFYSSGDVNVRVSIDARGVVNLSAAPDWNGVERVTFRATDALGALAEDSVGITVLPVDDAPFFRPIPTFYLNSTAGFLDLAPYLGDIDSNVTELTLSLSSPHATVIGQGVLFNYSADGTEDLEVVVSDGYLTNVTMVRVVVALPSGTAVVPAFLFWLPVVFGVAAAAGFVVYRRRQIEWVFLVNDGGLLVSSVATRNSGSIDTDLMTSMLTAIMDFAKASFSDETHGGLESLQLGDRKVEIERADRSFLAVVYRGRAPGALPRLMKALLRHLEARYPTAFTDIVDSSTLEDIPMILQRFATRAWWPFLSFPAVPEAEGSRRE